MAYLVNVKSDEQTVESPYRNTLKCITDAFEKLAQYEELEEKRPEIVCLCGPLRFIETFRRAEYDLEMQGKIVLAPSFLPGATEHDGMTGCTPEQKIMLDELHKRKIDLCDMVFVLNVNNYIGDSTKSEIEYAKKIGKSIYYLETPLL
jgi:hypothetical protein